MMLRSLCTGVVISQVEWSGDVVLGHWYDVYILDLKALVDCVGATFQVSVCWGQCFGISISQITFCSSI